MGRQSDWRACSRGARYCPVDQAMTDSPEERMLDFAGVLAELQALVGERVSIESGSEGAHPVHESRGVLGRSIDLQIAVGWPLDQPARVAFYLDETDSHFIVRESGLRAALAYMVELPEGPSRAVQMHFAGGAVLIVREDPADERARA